MRKLLVLAVATMTAAAVGVTAQSAVAGSDGGRWKNLPAAVTGKAVYQREQALQRIAAAHGGLRAAGYPGFEAGADYVERTMLGAGFAVREQHFTFPFYQELGPSSLSLGAAAYQSDTFDYSGNADLTAQVVPTTNVMVPPAPAPASASGCAVADFPPASSAVPKIALIQRGTCSFGDKVANAEAAGYAGAIVFNEGQPGRDGIINGTIGFAATIPVVGIDYADGAAIYNAAVSGGATVHLVTQTRNTPNTDSFNVIADSRGGDPSHVLVVGAHLDALPHGPGINENGSGVAIALEIAKQMEKLRLNPKYKIEFVFFGAEETRARRDPNAENIALLGSYNYVKALSPARLGKIYANLNLDTLGSVNYVRFVFNGDGPAGSAQLADLFTNYFTAHGLASEPHEPTTFDGTSLGPLADAGIATGGLFGGAAEIKTDDEAAVYGGTAGISYDPCFHQACDDIGNVLAKPLGEFGGATADAVWQLANTDQGLFTAAAGNPAAGAARPAPLQKTTGTFVGAPDAG